MKVFDASYLDGLSHEARSSHRKRMHRNLHGDHRDPCQRLWNAIEPESYIRPHRHLGDPKEETLIAVRGLMALVVFDDSGSLGRVVAFGAERSSDVATGVVVPPGMWHTVLSLATGSVLFEAKPGPFYPELAKDFAPWAPVEGSEGAEEYHRWLVSRVVPEGARLVRPSM
jgi:cupin fold WbuC family metalloprotein